MDLNTDLLCPKEDNAFATLSLYTLQNTIMSKWLNTPAVLILKKMKSDVIARFNNITNPCNMLII